MQSEREHPYLLVHSPSASDSQSQSQDKGTQSRTPTSVAGTQLLEPSPAVSQREQHPGAGVRYQSRYFDVGCGHLNM